MYSVSPSLVSRRTKHKQDIPERAVDPSTKDLIFWFGKIAYWTVWPIYTAIYYVLSYIAVVLLYIGKLIFRPLSFILAPFVYLARFLWACFLFPFHFLAKFEVPRASQLAFLAYAYISPDTLHLSLRCSVYWHRWRTGHQSPLRLSTGRAWPGPATEASGKNYQAVSQGEAGEEGGFRLAVPVSASRPLLWPRQSVGWITEASQRE